MFQTIIVTSSICIVCVIVYILQMFGLFPIETFAIMPSKILEGEVYRLLTGILMHGSYYHLLGNLSAFLNIGSFLEHYVCFDDRKQYMKILLGSFIGNSLMILQFGRDVYTVGLSGIVFGTLAAYFVYLYKNDNHFDQSELTQIARMLIPNIIISLFPGVSWQGHLGGFLGGLVSALIFIR